MSAEFPGRGFPAGCEDSTKDFPTRSGPDRARPRSPGCVYMLLYYIVLYYILPWLRRVDLSRRRVGRLGLGGAVETGHDRPAVGGQADL